MTCGPYLYLDSSGANENYYYLFEKIIGEFNYGKCFGYLVTWQTTPVLRGLKKPNNLFPYNFVTRSALLRDSSLLHLAWLKWLAGDLGLTPQTALVMGRAYRCCLLAWRATGAFTGAFSGASCGSPMCNLSFLTMKQLRSKKKEGGVGSLLKARLGSSTMMLLPCSMYQVPASAHSQEIREETLSFQAGVTQGGIWSYHGIILRCSNSP